MRAPLIMYLSMYAQALPPLAALVRRSARPAHLWIAFGSFATLGSDLLSAWVAEESGNNHWVWYLLNPVTGSAFLLALAHWQVSYIERLTMRLAVPAYLLAWVLLVAFLENTRTFSLYTSPMHSLLLLGAASWTLVRRGLLPSDTPILRTDWFWVSLGLAVQGAATAAFDPVAFILLPSRPELVVTAIQVRAAFYGTSFLLIAWGLLCPLPVRRSGPSSLPQPSA